MEPTGLYRFYAGIAVIFYAGILEVLGLNLCQYIICHGWCAAFLSYSRKTPIIIPWLLLSTSFPTHLSTLHSLAAESLQKRLTVTSWWVFVVLQVSLLVRRELTERARDFNIILDDVSITELSFGKEYTAAVEAKQVRALLHSPHCILRLTHSLKFCCELSTVWPILWRDCAPLNSVCIRLMLSFGLFAGCATGSTACSVRCGACQTGAPAEDCPGRGRGRSCQNDILSNGN